MEANIKDLSSVQKQIKVSLPANTVKAKIDQAFHVWQKRAAIKGFRPGKAPLELVRKEYKEEVEKEVMGDLIRDSLSDVISQHNLEPVDYPVLEERKFGLEGNFEYSVTMEVKPELKISGYGSLKLKRETATPGDAEVDKVIERMREQQAVLKDKEVTQAKAGDFISMNAEMVLEGKRIDKSKVENRVVPLGENYLLPEFEAAIPTMTVGETREIPVQFPTENTDKALAGKRGVFTVKLNGVKEKIKPAIDDALAKASGEAETLAELRQKISTQLKQESETLEKQRLEGEALQQVLSANPFEVPPSLVRSRYEHLLQRLARSGMRVESEEQAKQVQDDCYQRALTEVRADLAIESIAKQEAITVDDAAVEARIESIMATAPTERSAELRKMLDTPERRHMLREELLRTKTLAFIMSKATIK